MPVVRHQPQYHNPFPQLHRVAILPFFNLSSDPTVNQDEVAEAYFNELQQIPGFEVMPPGVAKQWLLGNRIPIDGSTDFQLLARQLGVDVVIRGAVTEYSPYYPPRIGLAVDWFAANPSFHPIPPGYGLPWGTSDEEYIPDSLVLEAEFALAREQLKTQTPDVPAEALGSGIAAPERSQVARARHVTWSMVRRTARIVDAEPIAGDAAGGATCPPTGRTRAVSFLRRPRRCGRPIDPQSEPVMTHTRLYHGDDDQLTQRLEDYCFFRDDARCGWLARLSPAQPRLYPLLLSSAYHRDARGSRGERENASGVAVANWPI